jgi:hypothetical protein
MNKSFFFRKNFFSRTFVNDSTGYLIFKERLTKLIRRIKKKKTYKMVSIARKFGLLYRGRQFKKKFRRKKLNWFFWNYKHLFIKKKIQFNYFILSLWRGIIFNTFIIFWMTVLKKQKQNSFLFTTFNKKQQYVIFTKKWIRIHKNYIKLKKFLRISTKRYYWARKFLNLFSIDVKKYQPNYIIGTVKRVRKKVTKKYTNLFLKLPTSFHLFLKTQFFLQTFGYTQLNNYIYNIAPLFLRMRKQTIKSSLYSFFEYLEYNILNLMVNFHCSINHYYAKTILQRKIVIVNKNTISLAYVCSPWMLIALKEKYKYWIFKFLKSRFLNSIIFYQLPTTSKIPPKWLEDYIRFFRKRKYYKWRKFFFLMKVKVRQFFSRTKQGLIYRLILKNLYKFPILTSIPAYSEVSYKLLIFCIYRHLSKHEKRSLFSHYPILF